MSSPQPHNFITQTADDGHLPAIIDFFDLPDTDTDLPLPPVDPNKFQLTPAQLKALDMLVSDATHCALGGGSSFELLRSGLHSSPMLCTGFGGSRVFPPVLFKSTTE